MGSISQIGIYGGSSTAGDNDSANAKITLNFASHSSTGAYINFPSIYATFQCFVNKGDSIYIKQYFTWGGMLMSQQAIIVLYYDASLHQVSGYKDFTLQYNKPTVY